MADPVIVGAAGVLVGTALNAGAQFASGWLTFRRERIATQDERQLVALRDLGRAGLDLQDALTRATRAPARDFMAAIAAEVGRRC